MKRILLLCILLGFFSTAFANNGIPSHNQDSIVNRYLKNGAWKHLVSSFRWQMCIDSGLKIDSTIAVLWQQKAMPYFKQRKYEVGLHLLEKAVKYDSTYLEYYAFMNCIFVKNYTTALINFKQCAEKDSQGYIMDHPYNFYMALCYLQLNNFNTAKEILIKLSNKQLTNLGFTHYLYYYYIGVCYYEQQDYNCARDYLNKCLSIYPQMPDAEYYKAHCFRNLRDKASYLETLKKANSDANLGYRINEDNAKYEQYPYQIYFSNIH